MNNLLLVPLLIKCGGEINERRNTGKIKASPPST